MSNSGLNENRDPLMDQELPNGQIRVKLVGVGGAGTNAIDRLKLDSLDQIHLSVINTDSQSLASSPVEEKILIGRGITRGLSTGGEVLVGKEAAESDLPLLNQLSDGVDLMFILAGLGGGTGSGAAPVLAEAARNQGALTIAFVTLPFSREGSRRMQQAEAALTELRQQCHAVITLPNDLLFQQIDENATVMEAFAIADNWINQGVRSIWSMLFQNGLINVDFASIKRSLNSLGNQTLFGTGYAKGEDFVGDALKDLEMCPLLHLPENRFVKRTDNLIVNITGGPDLTMAKINEVMEYVSNQFGCKDSMLLGAAIDGSMNQQLRITVLGTAEMNAGRSSPKPLKSYSSQITTPVHTSRLSTTVPKASRKKALSKNQAQEEFAFEGESDQRGFFEKTNENVYDGQDLDVPTFLRRGIKISLH